MTEADGTTAVTLAVDIGGTKVAAAQVLDDGTVVGPVLQAPTPAQDGAHAVLDLVVDLLARLDAAVATHVAVSSAGVIDCDRGVVVGATDSIVGWVGTDIAGALRRATGLPVHVLGDGHAFAVGEAVYGAARTHESVLLLAAGTGIGGSLVHGGVPMMGHRWAAGHFGHMPAPGADGEPCPCGATGHLEAIASGSGLVGWYHRQGGDGTVRSAGDLVARQSRDQLASTALHRAGTALGAAAAGLTNALDPSLVVVTGGLARAGAVWEQALRQAFVEGLLPVVAATPLRLSTQDSWSALRGAEHHARHRRSRQ